MSTLAAVVSRIADDLNNQSLTDRTVQQVRLAINAYKSTPFWWNEATTTLSVSQAYVAVPSDFVYELGLYIVESSVEIPLTKALNPQDIFAERPSTGGRPSFYTYFGDRFEFDRSANTVYSMPLRYIKALAPVSFSTSDGANAWLTDGEDLIVYRAEKVLFAQVVRDEAAARRAAELERQAYDLLMRQRDQRMGTGYARGWYL